MWSSLPINGKIHYVACACKSARRVSRKSHINSRRDVRVNDAMLVTSFVRGIQTRPHVLWDPALREPFKSTTFCHTGRYGGETWWNVRLPLGNRFYLSNAFNETIQHRTSWIVVYSLLVTIPDKMKFFIRVIEFLRWTS